MVKVSGIDTRPGTVVLEEGAPAVPFAALACAWLPPFACVTPLPAFCACLAGNPCAGGAPGAAGLFPPPGGVLPFAGLEPEPLDAAPGLKSPITTPVPWAALSSCTRRLGMSTVVGTALPSRSTVA